MTYSATENQVVVETEINSALFYNSKTWDRMARNSRIFADGWWVYTIDCNTVAQAGTAVESILNRPELANNFNIVAEIRDTTVTISVEVK